MSAKSENDTTAVTDEPLPEAKLATEVKMNVPPADALPESEVSQPKYVQESLPPPPTAPAPVDALAVPEAPQQQDIQKLPPPAGQQAEPTGKPDDVGEVAAEIKMDVPPTDALPVSEAPQPQEVPRPLEVPEVKVDVSASSAAPADALPVPEVAKLQEMSQPQEAKIVDTDAALPQDMQAPALAPPVPPTAAAVEEVPKQLSRKKARTAKPLAPLSASSENVPLTTRRAARLKSKERTTTTSDKGQQKQAKSTEPPTGQPADQESTLEGHVERYPQGHNIELK